MLRRLVHTIAFTVFLLGAPRVTAQRATYKGIPDGFDFPADQAKLLQMRDAEDVAAMRTHAWMVFAGMTQPSPGGEAVWETWFSTLETFRSGPAPQGIRRIQRRFRDPRQFQSTGLHPQAAGASLLSFTLFNQELREHVRDQNQLLSQAHLTEINQKFDADGTPLEKREINPFPARAVALKTTWWIVKKQGVTGIPVWDGDPPNGIAQGNPFSAWKRCVAVDPSRQTVPSAESRSVTCVGKTVTAHVVPLAHFYSFSISPTEVAAIRNTRAIGARTVQAGDFAVLLALHYTTKEIPEWVWSTFWWHDQPDDGFYSNNRPSAVPGVWRNYLMSTAYSMDTPKESDGQPHITFNPWLEAGFSNGTVSNCMSCHRQAVWPIPDHGNEPPFLPVTRGTIDAKDANYFKGNTKLDFLWSVAFESQ